MSFKKVVKNFRNILYGILRLIHNLTALCYDNLSWIVIIFFFYFLKLQYNNV